MKAVRAVAGIAANGHDVAELLLVIDPKTASGLVWQ